MGIRDQRIDIGSGIEKIRRSVYDNRSLPEFKLQTGYVQYDNAAVPVWRPYDPSDSDVHAAWREGTWRNIFMTRVRFKKDVRHLLYETDAYPLGSASVELPATELVLTFALRAHLEQVQSER